MRHTEFPLEGFLSKPHFFACCLMSSEALMACCKAWQTEKWEGPNGQSLMLLFGGNNYYCTYQIIKKGN